VTFPYKIIAIADNSNKLVGLLHYRLCS